MFTKLAFLILIVSIFSSNSVEEEGDFPEDDFERDEFVADDFEVDSHVDLFECKHQKKSIRKLNMTVFYESLCPDSIRFFKKQFNSTWKPFYNYLNITLVPYGKATQKQDKKGNWDFECQHGEEECQNNRIQACAIKRLKKLRPLKLYGFISCYMSTKQQEKNAPKCAKKYNIAFKKLIKCASSKEGDELLARYGNITHNFRPNISWIPTIVFNDTFSNDDNNQAAQNLTSLLCQKLNNKPKKCET